MSDTTVKELAEVVGIPVDRLLVQLVESGLPHKNADQSINEQDKRHLLGHLRRLHGKNSGPTAATAIAEAPATIAPPPAPASKKLSVAARRGRDVGEVKVTSSAGRRKTVTVEVRRKRRPTASAVPAKVAEPALVDKVKPEAAENGSERARQVEAQEAAKRALHEEAKTRLLERDEQMREAAAQREQREREERAAEEERRRIAAEDREREEREERERAATAPEPELQPEPSVEAADAVAEPIATEGPAKAGKDDGRAAGGKADKPAKKGNGKETDRTLAKARDQVVAEQAAATAAAKSGPSRRAGEGAGPRRGDRPERRGGRQELHVTGEKGRRRRKTKTRTTVTASDNRHGFAMPTAPVVREVLLPETITVGDLAQRLSMKAPELIKAMMNLGTMATINQMLDQDTATLVVEELGHRAKALNENALEEEVISVTVAEEEQEGRCPVVTIMGHVDHGKTSLLDYIRRSRVAAGEAGGITQHIGAYRVSTEHGDITFLDTPGHEAFTAMRARGAQATDIVVLVVAADDGVMPQTVEAVQHARAAGVPMIIAVNKIDKADANPDRVKQELSNHKVIPEDWGGDTQFVHVSALTGDNVEALLEAVSLQSELLELKAPGSGPARGVVVESRLDRGRGSVATVLVQAGELRKGDILLAGREYGRVRSLFDDAGNSVDSAGPSTPVEVLGLSGTPSAGDEAVVVADERKAREVASQRQGKFREVRIARQHASLENVFGQIGEGSGAALNLVIKADVQGSVEALQDALIKLSTDEVQVKVVASGVGGLSEADVNLAVASGATILAFNVRADTGARRLVEAESVDVRYFSVIYEAIDTVRQAMSGMLAPEIREEFLGLAEVRDVFRSKRFGAVAGCMVVDGTIKRTNPIRVLRDNVVIYEGELESLRRFQDDVSEVKSGTECGIGVRNYNDVKVGDQIEVYERVEVDRQI